VKSVDKQQLSNLMSNMALMMGENLPQSNLADIKFSGNKKDGNNDKGPSPFGVHHLNGGVSAAAASSSSSASTGVNDNVCKEVTKETHHLFDKLPLCYCNQLCAYPSTIQKEGPNFGKMLYKCSAAVTGSFNNFFTCLLVFEGNLKGI